MIPPQGAYTQDRYDLAKRAADVFLSYDNKPPEWEATYDGLKAKAEAIAESMQSGEYWAPVEED
jgi:exonuclease V gamma subunit